MSDNFIYYVSITGITGERESLPWQELKSKVEEIKKMTDKKLLLDLAFQRENMLKLYQALQTVL
jgi:Tryptophan synthase alpha chain.